MGQMLTESAAGITVGVGFGLRPSHNPPELAGLIVCCFVMQGEHGLRCPIGT